MLELNSMSLAAAQALQWLDDCVRIDSLVDGWHDDHPESSRRTTIASVIATPRVLDRELADLRYSYQAIGEYLQIHRDHPGDETYNDVISALTLPAQSYLTAMQWTC